MTEIVVTGQRPGGPTFYQGLLSTLGAFAYYAGFLGGSSTPAPPPVGAILTDLGGNKIYNGSKRANSVQEVADFIAAFQALKQSVLNNIDSNSSYQWTDALGNVHSISGIDYKMHLFNISWVFVDGDFSQLNGGVGMNQTYGQYDPRSQVTIDLAAMVLYMSQSGGLNYIVLHELFHSSFYGRAYSFGSHPPYSAGWNARELGANDFSKAMGGYAGVPIISLSNSDPRNPGFSH